MGSVLVVLFWIWCGMSVAILVARPFYRRAQAARGPTARMTPASVEVSPVEHLAPMGAVAPHPSTTTRSRSVADVLEGLRLPCDLAPLIGGEPAGDPSYVAFMTEGHPPEAVGVSVGDELERIGCTLTPVDVSTLRADRGEDVVEVRIHPEASTAVIDKRPRFPTVPPRSVVVEFQLRR